MNIIEEFYTAGTPIKYGARIVEYPERPECERYEAQYYEQFKAEGEHKEGWRAKVCGNILQCHMCISGRKM